MDGVGNGGRLVVVFVFVAVVLGGCDGSANGVVSRCDGSSGASPLASSSRMEVRLRPTKRLGYSL